MNNIELAVGNIVRRVLRLIRDVYVSEGGEDGFGQIEKTTKDDQENDSDDEEMEEEKFKRPAKPRQLSYYDYPSSTVGVSTSRFFGSSSSMINLLGDNSTMAKKTSLESDKKSHNILSW